ncbi:CAP domain-containing protein [Streptomyces sp. L7]
MARGQADAAAVMDAWMNSPGHKANILNCDFKTLGVGVHFGTGGPVNAGLRSTSPTGRNRER